MSWEVSLTLFGVVLIFRLVMTRVPLMGTAILAELNHNNVSDVFNSLG